MAVSPSELCTSNSSRKPTLRELLNRNEPLVIAAELGHESRPRDRDQDEEDSLAGTRAVPASADPHALDHPYPGGHAMLAADTLGTDLIARGQEVIIHLACEDWNRNALESRGWKLSSKGFHNVLALSGDYPVSGYRSHRSTGVRHRLRWPLRMFTDMNEGFGDAPLGATDFFLGCVVANHERHERDVPQCFKLRKKIQNGSRFVINQLGYDARKDDELLRWMALDGLEVPVMANVYFLTLSAARVFNSGRIPGVVVTDELLALVQDRGLTYFLELAAKQVAIAHGLGFAGVYLGGQMSVEDYDRILTTVETYASADWKEFAKEIQSPIPDEFHCFQRDPTTSLSATELTPLSTGSRPFRYRVNGRVHALAFVPETPLFRAGRTLYAPLETNPRPLRTSLHLVERAVKVAMFGARTAATAHSPTSRTSAPSRSAPRTSATAPVVARARASAG